MMVVEGGGEKEDGRGEKGIVFMWGYLPGASPHMAPILSPKPVPETAGDPLVDVCGGGCGFAVAISESGKLNTWGSTDSLGQSYVVAGKHKEMPEPFPLPTEAAIIKAAASWANCVAVTVNGDVCTWGWKECVPTGKVVEDLSIGEDLEKNLAQRHNDSLVKQVNSRSQVRQEGIEQKRLPEKKGTSESSSTVTHATISTVPCLVSLSRVRIATVAAGGRHTLALSVFCDSGSRILWYPRLNRLLVLRPLLTAEKGVQCLEEAWLLILFSTRFQEPMLRPLHVEDGIVL